MSSMRSFAVAVAPVVLAAAATGIVASVAQVGLHFSTKSLQPSFNKLNVFTGLKRMFGVNQVVELGKSLSKIMIVGVVAGTAFWSHMTEFSGLVGLQPGLLLVAVSKLVLSIGLRVAVALFVVAALDYIWQRHKFEKSLKMTKDEVKREAREADLPPELRGQIRKKLTEASRRRMMTDVPTADVVVVNPTHYAVALRYDPTKSAPEVVAKGIDELALTIRRIAEEAGVTIVHQPPLARALYRDVELGHDDSGGVLPRCCRSARLRLQDGQEPAPRCLTVLLGLKLSRALPMTRTWLLGPSPASVVALSRSALPSPPVGAVSPWTTC